MKKHLIAAAVAGAFAVPAMAQVTVYGLLDAGYNTVKQTQGTTVNLKTTGMNSIQSGSRVGFRGEEDLGGGLKASFVIENSFTPEESSTSFGATNRQSFIGLAGGFGSLTVGRQYSLIWAAQASQDPNGNASQAGWLPGLTNSVRLDDYIQYTTPSFSGLSVSLGMGLAGSETSTAAGATKAGDVTTFGVTYAAGPLNVRVVSETTKRTALSVNLPGFGAAQATAAANTGGVCTAANRGCLSNALTDRDAMTLSAIYDLGVAKVSVVATEAEAGTAADKGEVSTTNLGVSVPLGALTLGGSISQGEYKDSNAAKVDLSGYMLGVSYALSKRTNAYAFIGEAKDKAVVNSGKHSTSAVGIRHTF